MARLSDAYDREYVRYSRKASFTYREKDTESSALLHALLISGKCRRDTAFSASVDEARAQRNAQPSS